MKQATREKYTSQLYQGAQDLQALSAAIPGDAVEWKDRWKQLWAARSAIAEDLSQPNANVVEMSNRLRTLRHGILVLTAKVKGEAEPLFVEEEQEDLIETLPQQSLHREILTDIKNAQALLLGAHNKLTAKHRMAKMVPCVIEIKTVSDRIGALMKDVSKMEGVE